MAHGRGLTLEIDLSGGKIEKREVPPYYNENYLGGRGVDTKILWDRVPPEAAPFSEENLLIFSNGILSGTPTPGANRTIVSTRSPQTNLLTYSIMGGYWAPELKHAGYERVILSGKSSAHVYLWIHDGDVEIRDASHLWGKDVKETQRLIREELKVDKAQILCIGPAGENKVYAASIEHSTGASASRGVGPIMGHKNVKAIAVHGTKDVSIAKPSEFAELCGQIIKKTGRMKAFFENFSYESANFLMDYGSYGNLEGMMKVENSGKMHEDFVKSFKTRGGSCYNCGLCCKPTISMPDGGYSYVKCQSWFTFMFACKIQDFTFSLKCYNLCEKYGLDAISAANYIAFIIDLYGKGILTKKDTEGIHLEWGNKELAFLLIEKIARREGIGALMANGVHEAARLIGKGAEEHVHHVKKLELIPFDLYMPYLALCTAVSDKGDMTRLESSFPQHWLAESRSWKEEYLKTDFFNYPEEFRDYILDDFDWKGYDYERQAQFVSYDLDKNTLSDCAGLCIFWTGFYIWGPINLRDVVKLISCVTGMTLDKTEAVKIAKRIGALLRAYNVILGIRRKDDKVPEKYFRGSPPPPLSPLDHNRFDKMIDEYYRLRGWNQEGIPHREALNGLDLDDVKQELERRGIL